MPTIDESTMHRPYGSHETASFLLLPVKAGPHAINVPPITLPELLAQAAHDFPAAPAILFYGITISYAELDALAWRFASALVRAGVAPGESGWRWCCRIRHRR